MEVRRLEAVARVARAHGCRRLWLVTTQDNRGAVREARRLKPEIPERGEGGVPIEDEDEDEIRV